jgi:MFS transporter, ACDE family, multidrug resistance protein
MNSPEDNSQFKRQKPVYLELNFQIICAVVLIAVIGVSSVTPAFPRLAKMQDDSLKTAPVLSESQ